MLPQIYLVQTPPTPHARRLLRLRVLDMFERLSRVEGLCWVILNVPAEDSQADVVVLRPRSVVVGLINELEGPLDIEPNGQWFARATRAPVGGTQGETPLAQIQRVRAAVLGQLEPLAPALGTVTGALVVAPSIHPESRVSLDVESHRQRIKVLGMDELAPLVSMLQSGAQLDEAAMRRVVEMLDAHLWHDGEGLLFEIGLAPYRLRVLDQGTGDQQTLTLLEGATVIGRRSGPLQHEYRLSIEGDDSISADHAILICGADGRVTLRDTSTNGSYIRTPAGEEARVHRAERPVVPGDIIRMGVTEFRLEAVS